MNSKQKKTLEKIRKLPTASDLKWADAISLLRSVRSDVDEARNGSRVFINYGGTPVVLHKPHGAKPMVKSAVDQIREILQDV